MNTDVPGFLASLDDASAGSVSGRTAVVLGAGGAARAIVFALLSRGAERVFVVNRTRATADTLASFFGPKVSAVDWSQMSSVTAGCDLLVNTTRLGMQGEAALNVNLDVMKSSATVIDIVYRPLETELLRCARQRGLVTVDGLGMLLHQAALAFEAWFGKRPQVTPELRMHLLAQLGSAT